MEGLFFATGPVAQWERDCEWCARCRCFITVYNDWRLESSLVRVYFGAQVFSGGFCGLEVASNLLRTSGK